MKENIDIVIQNLVELQQKINALEKSENETIKKALRNIERLGLHPKNILDDAMSLKVYVDRLSRL